MIPVEVEVDSELIELVADDRPVDVEVDSEATVLSVELRPVDNELMPVEVEVDSDEIELVADDRPVDVEVDSEATELLVELSPVDNELIPVEVDVDRLAMFDVVALATAYSWLPLIASVLFGLTRPAATFWIRRSRFGWPTLTRPPAGVPAA
ncbi:chromosome segregation ATPase [Burkholderia territorii]|nr:chromosome segregation ATPase [Burkholderia territorii]